MADEVRVTIGGQEKSALLVSGGATGGSADQVQGNVASGIADSGNPVKVGGVYNSTLPTLTTGQRGDLQVGSRGALAVSLFSQDSTTAISGVADNADGVAVISALGRIGAAARGYVFNGTTWDRQRGDTVGAYMVATPSASANNAITPIVNGGVSSLVVKASAGNLYYATIQAGATGGFLIAYNATAAPAGGAALTGSLVLDIVPVAANGFATLGGRAIPERYSAGIVLLFSTSLSTYTVPANLANHMKGAAA